MLKRSIEAVNNVNQPIAEVISSLPRLLIWNKMNSIRHYLETFQHLGVSKNDVYIDYLNTELRGCSGSIIAEELKHVGHFLE